MLLGKRGDQGMAVARPISADRDVLSAPPVQDLGQRTLPDSQVIGGATVGVPRPQNRREGLVVVARHTPRG